MLITSLVKLALFPSFELGNKAIVKHMLLSVTATATEFTIICIVWNKLLHVMYLTIAHKVSRIWGPGTNY